MAFIPVGVPLSSGLPLTGSEVYKKIIPINNNLCNKYHTPLGVVCSDALSVLWSHGNPYTHSPEPDWQIALATIGNLGMVPGHGG